MAVTVMREPEPGVAPSRRWLAYEYHNADRRERLSCCQDYRASTNALGLLAASKIGGP